jgi:hypothetical protein
MVATRKRKPGFYYKKEKKKSESTQSEKLKY